MNRFKVLLISFCLMVSMLLSLTPTYCVSYFTYSLFFYPVEGYEDLYKNPTVSLTRSGTTESYDLAFDDVNNIYYVNVSLATNSNYTYDFYCDGELIESGTLMGSTNKYVFIYLTKYPESTEDTESSESTESTEDTESSESTESTETPIVSFDDTNINGNLEKIINRLDTFIAIFVFYFGYKIIKEIVNKFERTE